jgi:hypothetical protein
LKTTYTEEAIADIVEAINYLNERNPAAAAISTPRSRDASSAWRPRNSRVLSRGYNLARSCEVGPSRRSASTTSGILPNC